MIPAALDRLKAARFRTLGMIADCSQEVMDRAPDNPRWLSGEAGRWSIGEVVDHIVKVMHSLTGHIEDLIRLHVNGQEAVITLNYKDYDVSPFFMPRQLMPVAEPMFKMGNRLVSALLPFRFRETFFRSRSFPIRNPTQWLPEQGRPLDDLRSELMSSIDSLVRLFEQQPDLDFDQLVLEHSIYGRHTVPQLLEVLLIHEEWHHPDIERLLPETA